MKTGGDKRKDNVTEHFITRGITLPTHCAIRIVSDDLRYYCFKYLLASSAKGVSQFGDARDKELDQ